jgi:hypothetical protein
MRVSEERSMPEGGAPAPSPCTALDACGFCGAGGRTDAPPRPLRHLLAVPKATTTSAAAMTIGTRFTRALLPRLGAYRLQMSLRPSRFLYADGMWKLVRTTSSQPTDESKPCQPSTLRDGRFSNQTRDVGDQPRALALVRRYRCRGRSVHVVGPGHAGRKHSVTLPFVEFCVEVGSPVRGPQASKPH